MITCDIDPRVKNLLAGIVDARGLQIEPATPELRGACDSIVQHVLREGLGGGESRRDAVRGLLRAGGFKPSGRNKPAQEYLWRTVSEARTLPAILNAVDWLNSVSLACGLPISLLSFKPLEGGAVIRYGRPGESFVFNRSGQQLDLEGLLCVCGAGEAPLGTPIKDSMAGKIENLDHDVVAVIYAPRGAISREELAAWGEKLGGGFAQYCHAQTWEVVVREADPGTSRPLAGDGDARGS